MVDTVNDQKAATCYGWGNENRSAGLWDLRAEPRTVRMGDTITDTGYRTGLTGTAAGTAAAPAGRGRTAGGAGAAERHGGEQLHRVVMASRTPRRRTGLAHRPVHLEGVAAGAAAVLVARHANRLRRLGGLGESVE